MNLFVQTSDNSQIVRWKRFSTYGKIISNLLLRAVARFNQFKYKTRNLSILTWVFPKIQNRFNLFPEIGFASSEFPVLINWSCLTSIYKSIMLDDRLSRQRQDYIDSLNIDSRCWSEIRHNKDQLGPVWLWTLHLTGRPKFRCHPYLQMITTS